MRNLESLYGTDASFKEKVDMAAADAIGTTSAEFAAEWLAMPADDGKPVGSLGRENLRAEVAHLEAQVERLRGKLGEAADLACAIERTCMGGYAAVVDTEAEAAV